MTGQRSWSTAVAALTAGLLGLASVLPASQEATAPVAVRIGLVRTLMRDVPEPMVQLMAQPFSTLMRAQTGLTGQLIPCRDAYELGLLLHEGKMGLGVFNGFEFGWAKQKYPDLRPLCIAINRHQHLTANIVVRGDSEVARIDDLKNKVIALPRYSQEQCRLFLNHACRASGSLAKSFFAKVATPANVEDALDDVLRGKLDAAIVDGVALECYEQVKAACFARLRVLKRSEVFPAAVVAYRQGTLDDSTLARFRDGMVSANQNERGRDLMALWKITAFEDVPADYAATVANIVRAYPYAATCATKADASE